MRHTLAIAMATVSMVALTIPRSAARAADEISVANMPPVVVSTWPRSGNTQVDPSTTEIRVTFSKEMTDGNWSWTQISDESFPERNGEIRYLEDKRTCVMPVKLKPGRTYVTWLNSARFGNFKDTAGRSAVPYLLVFETADKVGRNAQVRDKAAAAMALLKAALQRYRLDTGGYPTTAQRLEALRRSPADLAKPADWQGPYVKDPLPLDPWGSPYQYRSPGKKDPDGFDIWSFGPDRVDGTDDDVVP